MAYSIISKPNTDGSGGSIYPYGKIKDRSGGVPGTPVNTKVYGDFHQFFAKIMDEANIDFNAAYDGTNVGGILTFQYYDALNALIKNSVGHSYHAKEEVRDSPVSYGRFLQISFDEDELLLTTPVSKSISMECSFKGLGGHSDVCFPLSVIATVTGNGSSEPIVLADVRTLQNHLYRDGNTLSQMVLYKINRSATSVTIDLYWYYIDKGLFMFTPTHLFTDAYLSGNTDDRYKGISFIDDDIIDSAPTGWVVGEAESALDYLNNTVAVDTLITETVDKESDVFGIGDFSAVGYSMVSGYCSARMINDKSWAINYRAKISKSTVGAINSHSIELNNTLLNDYADITEKRVSVSCIARETSFTSEEQLVFPGILVKTGGKMILTVLTSIYAQSFAINQTGTVDASFDIVINE